MNGNIKLIVPCKIVGLRKYTRAVKHLPHKSIELYDFYFTDITNPSAEVAIFCAIAIFEKPEGEILESFDVILLNDQVFVGNLSFTELVFKTYDFLMVDEKLKSDILEVITTYLKEHADDYA